MQQQHQQTILTQDNVSRLLFVATYCTTICYQSLPKDVTVIEYIRDIINCYGPILGVSMESCKEFLDLLGDDTLRKLVDDNGLIDVPQRLQEKFGRQWTQKWKVRPVDHPAYDVGKAFAAMTLSVDGKFLQPQEWIHYLLTEKFWQATNIHDFMSNYIENMENDTDNDGPAKLARILQSMVELGDTVGTDAALINLLFAHLGSVLVPPKSFDPQTVKDILLELESDYFALEYGDDDSDKDEDCMDEDDDQ